MSKYTKRDEMIYNRLCDIYRIGSCDSMPLDYQLRQMGYISMNDGRTFSLTGSGIRAMLKLKEKKEAAGPVNEGKIDRRRSMRPYRREVNCNGE